MKYNKKITYSTGEFASHFGIKKDTLFYYDKINLFSPAGVMENGYRYYTASQIEPFRTLLSFRELNVPIKKLDDYFRNPSPEKLESLSLSQLDQIKAEMEKLVQIQNHLTQITNALQEASEAETDKVLVQNLPPVYLLCSEKTDGSLETSEQQWAEIHDSFIKLTDISGLTNTGSVIAESDIINGNFDRISFLYAESPTPTEYLREGGLYAVYYHKGNYDKVKYSYLHMLQQIADLGFTPVGDAYEEYLISEAATKNEEEYMTKILIQIKK